MAKVYLSPSNHGVGVNRCLWKGCYEDKHTRPIAEACAKYLRASGIATKVAAADTSVMNGARNREANRFGADLYVPIHTNASGASSARYLLFMFWEDNATYRKLFNAVAPYLEAIYPDKLKAKFSVRKDLYEVKTPSAKTLYCELGFHTNRTDCDHFIHNYDAVGKALAKGICNYFGVKFKGADSDRTPSKPKDRDDDKVVSEDGTWGKTTTIYTQKFFKTIQDGIISGQRKSCKKYLPNASTTSWQFKLFGKGSPVIRKLQKFVKVKADGLAGKNTVKGLQRFLKNKGLYTGAIDGIMGKGTVKSWQKFLNSQF